MRDRIRRFNENNVVGCIVRSNFPVLSCARKRCSGLLVPGDSGPSATDWFPSLPVLLVPGELQVEPVLADEWLPVSSVSTAVVSVSVGSIHPVSHTRLVWLPAGSNQSSRGYS